MISSTNTGLFCRAGIYCSVSDQTLRKNVARVRLKDLAGEVSLSCLGQRFKSQLKFQLTGPHGFLL